MRLQASSSTVLGANVIGGLQQCSRRVNLGVLGARPGGAEALPMLSHVESELTGCTLLSGRAWGGRGLLA